MFNSMYLNFCPYISRAVHKYHMFKCMLTSIHPYVQRPVHNFTCCVLWSWEWHRREEFVTEKWLVVTDLCVFVTEKWLVVTDLCVFVTDKILVVADLCVFVTEKWLFADLCVFVTEKWLVVADLCVFVTEKWLVADLCVFVTEKWLVADVCMSAAFNQSPCVSIFFSLCYNQNKSLRLHGDHFYQTLHTCQDLSGWSWPIQPEQKSQIAWW